MTRNMTLARELLQRWFDMRGRSGPIDLVEETEAFLRKEPKQLLLFSEGEETYASFDEIVDSLDWLIDNDFEDYQEVLKTMKQASSLLHLLSFGVENIALERVRQINVEGWDADHDDRHINGEMATAAAAYCEAANRFTEGVEELQQPEIDYVLDNCWPVQWSQDWFKPTSRERCLEKAGALIAAELERLHRRGANG